MKPGPKCSRNWRRPVMRFTIDGVVGCWKSASPGARTREGVSKSIWTPWKPYSETMEVTEETKLGISPGSSKGGHDLLALALERSDVSLQLIGLNALGWLEMQGSVGSAFFGRCEGGEDDIPLRRDVMERKGCVAAAEPGAGPVADKLMAVGGRAGWSRRGGGLCATGHAHPAIGTWLSRFRKRVRIGEAVGAGGRRGCSRRCSGAQIPGEQGDV